MIKLEGMLINPATITFIERDGLDVVIHFVSGETVRATGEEATYVWNLFDKDDWRE